MIKELKYFLYAITIIGFIFFILNYYFSDKNKKNSYRSLTNINNKINLYAENLPTLENNTKNTIEYINESKTKKKKKYYFWELLDKND